MNATYIGNVIHSVWTKSKNGVLLVLLQWCRLSRAPQNIHKTILKQLIVSNQIKNRTALIDLAQFNLPIIFGVVNYIQQTEHFYSYII